MEGGITKLLLNTQAFCSGDAYKNRVAINAMDELDAEEAAIAMRERREALGWSAAKLVDIARAHAKKAGDPIKLSQQLISNFENGSAKRIPSWLRYVELAFDEGERPSTPMVGDDKDYVRIDILPSYAGMGGGGLGEGVVEFGMVSRALVEDELKAKPTDMLLVEARGESMMPDFQHGDQILIDKRDTNPVQPGSFCLWDGDGYVIKLVEKIPMQPGRFRIFSANGRFSSYEVGSDEIRIMGRPVWFARRI